MESISKCLGMFEEVSGYINVNVNILGKVVIRYKENTFLMSIEHNDASSEIVELERVNDISL